MEPEIIVVYCVVAVPAAVGHSRGRGLLKFSTGSPTSSGLNTRPPGQVQWVSEQWSPPVVTSSPSVVNPTGLLLTNTEAASPGVRQLSALSPAPSHSTPTLSLHSKDLAELRASGTQATADLSPPAVSLRSASKRTEMHSTAVNGNIPLMTSASDPLPVHPHASRGDPVFRSPSPSLCLSKTARASPHHMNIQTAQSNSSTPTASANAPSMSPVVPMSPVGMVSWPTSSASAMKSPYSVSASADSSSTQSLLSPLAPLFVPQHFSADNNLVSVRLYSS